MTPEQERILHETHKAAVATEQLLNGAGGIVERIGKVETKVAEHDSLKSKLMAMASIISIGAGVAAQWAKDKFFGKD